MNPEPFRGRRVPVGLVSLRDLVGDRPGTTGGRMTRPAATVAPEARIAEAASRLSRTG